MDGPPPPEIAVWLFIAFCGLAVVPGVIAFVCFSGAAKLKREIAAYEHPAGPPQPYT